MPYFHATWDENIASILKYGLGGKPPRKVNFDGATPGVYLSVDPVIAFGFLFEVLIEGEDEPEASPKVMMERMRLIVIDDSRINLELLVDDPMVDRKDLTKLYRGIIDVNGMPILKTSDVFPG